MVKKCTSLLISNYTVQNIILGTIELVKNENQGAVRLTEAW